MQYHVDIGWIADVKKILKTKFSLHFCHTGSSLKKPLRMIVNKI